MEYLHPLCALLFCSFHIKKDNNFSLLVFWFMSFFSLSALKDPGGLTDYIDAEYIPDFLGGPYEVRSH